MVPAHLVYDTFNEIRTEHTPDVPQCQQMLDYFEKTWIHDENDKHFPIEMWTHYGCAMLPRTNNACDFI